MESAQEILVASFGICSVFEAEKRPTKGLSPFDVRVLF